jgi:prepilin-type N-terminal cleavage/methylation domain-containing protein
MFKKMRLNSGFTLLELMTTVVIIGITAAMIAPGFDRAARRIEFKSDSKDIVSILRTARSYAISEKTRFGVDFDQSSNKVSLYKEESVPENGSFDAGTDSVYQTISMDTTNSYMYQTFSDASIQFRPNGSASETGYIAIGYDNGEIICHSAVSVLASTGRAKLDYIYNY